MTGKYINPSGFVENLPHEQIVEDDLKDAFRSVAELFGYSHLETSSVEYLDTLASEGEINKEIYAIERSQGEGSDSESRRGLHFDLTVPFARYVAQNQGELIFPFRRYQIQKVWRGERPQKGRFREFYQADVDVVSRETLPIQFDAEIAAVMAGILTSFDIGPITMRINNRKFLNGIFSLAGVEPSIEILQIVDKKDKIGVAAVKDALIERFGMSRTVVDNIFNYLGEIVPIERASKFIESIPSGNQTFEEGKQELLTIFALLSKLAASGSNVKFVLDPSIARGLDYYTGTVFETTIDGIEKYGSICSGGRYNDLASRFTNQKLPGVGMSIGLTRLLSILKEQRGVKFDKKNKCDLVVCTLNESQMEKLFSTAESLRKQGINTLTDFRHSSSLKKILSDAEARGIKFAIVCENDGTLSLYEIGAGRTSGISIEEIVQRVSL